MIDYKKGLLGEYDKNKNICKSRTNGIISQGGDTVSVMVMLICLDKLHGIEWEKFLHDGDISLREIEEIQSGN